MSGIEGSLKADDFHQEEGDLDDENSTSTFDGNQDMELPEVSFQVSCDNDYSDDEYVSRAHLKQREKCLGGGSTTSG